MKGVWESKRECEVLCLGIFSASKINNIISQLKQKSFSSLFSTKLLHRLEKEFLLVEIISFLQSSDVNWKLPFSKGERMLLDGEK